MIINSLLHEAIYFFGDFLSRVEESLLLIVLPVEGQVHDANGFPEVAQLGASAINHPGDFVGHHELQVLYDRKQVNSLKEGHY